MNLKETEQLLREMSAIDGRQITAERIQAWQAVLGFMSLDIAKQAHIMARQDDSITYLEPKHIIAKAKEAAAKLDYEERKQTAMAPKNEPYKGIPAPNCKHGSTIAVCRVCAREMWNFHKRHQEQDYGDKLCLQFARENLYA